MDKNFINDLRARSKDNDGEAPVSRRRGGKGKLYLWVGGAIVVVIALGLVVTTMRATATVKVTPVQQVVTIDHVIAAYERGSEGAGTPFDRISVSESTTISVPATGVRNVSEKAKGVLVIENTSDKTQRFVAKTRFQSTKGQVYRTQAAVVIPAAVKGGAPGTAEATVVADSAGDSANLDAGATFTVPGLKGGPLYAQVTAKAKSGITGGFVGAMKTAAPDQIKAAEDKAKSELTAKLLEKMKSALPQDAIAYDDALFATFSSSALDGADKSNYGETITGTETAFVFKKADLASAIAQRTTTDLASSTVDAIGLDKLSMRILGHSSIDPRADTRFSFNLQGSVKLVWQYDKNELVKSLLGVARDRYQEVFRRFPTIERAEATFKPKWRQTFPTDPEKITIETVVTS